jgi:hypothetical protein
MQATSLTAGWNVETAFVSDWTKALEESWCHREEWPTIWRPTEYLAFKAVLGRFRHLMETKRKQREQEALLVMKLARWYRVRHPEMNAAERMNAISSRLCIPVRDVENALNDADSMALAEMQ